MCFEASRHSLTPSSEMSIRRRTSATTASSLLVFSDCVSSALSAASRSAPSSSIRACFAGGDAGADIPDIDIDEAVAAPMCSDEIDGVARTGK